MQNVKKLTTLLVVLVATFSARGQQHDAPPSLSLVEAASIAEAKIIEMKLPAEFYLRSIYLNNPTASDSGPRYYIASYSPKLSASDPTPLQKLALDKFVRIDLDGTTTLVGNEIVNEGLQRPRRIIIRPKTPDADSVKKEDANTANQTTQPTPHTETRQAPSPPTPTVDSRRTSAIGDIVPEKPTPPSIESMRALGRLASTGDFSAIDEIENIHNAIYRDIDRNDSDGMVSNLMLMRSAFSEIGGSVSGTDENDPAFRSLVYATGKGALGAFTADAFGIAAAKGHKPSLQVLLHHNRYGILLSSATFALCKPAEAGHEDAIKFLIEVIESDTSKALWHAASKGLVNAANQGNADAQQALLKFEKHQKDRMKSGPQ